MGLNLICNGNKAGQVPMPATRLKNADGHVVLRAIKQLLQTAA